MGKFLHTFPGPMTLDEGTPIAKPARKIAKEYGEWETHPHIIKFPVSEITAIDPELTKMETMYEGSVGYLRFWNFWVRVGTPAKPPGLFFHNFESGTAQVWDLINAIGAPTAWPNTQNEIWKRIATVWTWLSSNVEVDDVAYASLIAKAGGNWPSIDDYAQYYAAHKKLVWSACFSKAHLFATLLGRVLPRWHTLIAEAHHTEGGAPQTASHVYVGVYLADRWYYLDPTETYGGPLPDFQNRKSVGAFKKVDYEHPYEAIPVPLSPFDMVPYLPS
jgi:hypothetical protein